MKQTELMIGDWVHIPMLDIDIENYVCYSQVRQLHDCDLDCYAFKELKYEEVEPIPLTAEILERNGFLLKGKKGKKDISDSAYKQWSFTKSTSRITVTFFQNLWMIDVRNNGKVKSKPIRMVNYLIDGNRAYLHDLQHALRSGGLTDLADKLKMEE